MSWLVFAVAVILVCLIAWAIGSADVSAEMDREKRFEHRHDFQRVGYGGAGWSLYRCECGAEEIDA